VLVMDDEPDILNYLHTALTQLGFEVEQAPNGEDALRRYREASESGRPFGAVILDLTVAGGMGGRETIERLLKSDPQARAIVSSGYANDPLLSEFGKYGFQGAVAKPYEVKELAEALRRILAHPPGQSED
jgi:CheY-like chemotaxis protein